MIHAEVVRVFCRGTQGGNQLGVIEDARTLSDGQMQSIAAELGFSETVFLFDPQSTRPRVRIFTPKNEMEFAGHPLVGAAWFLSVLRGRALSELQCELGPVGTEISGEESWIHAGLDQPVRPADPTFARRAGMPDPRNSFTVAMPKEYILYEYGSVAEIAALAPSMEILSERFLIEAFARNGNEIRARIFAPAAGVPEDPATGSAAIALAALLRSQGEANGQLEIQQGEEMGQPSTIRLRWNERAVSIGGLVVHEETRVVNSA